MAMLHSLVNLLSLLPRLCMQAYARVKLTGLPMVSKTGVLHARVILAVSPTTMSHGRGYLSHPVLGKNFLPCFHTVVFQPMVCARPTGRPCAWPCGFEKPVFNDLIRLIGTSMDGFMYKHGILDECGDLKA
ncbi:hypothetical protein GOBAR_AA18555 [Gossypium barbadense]|uniref:Secreted protein n=1 Tax=Gossypium barbadense TaxID=3634 RepID=A0A2P5XFI4_GOSBA|nr:hypothetical protein GOBAR_AA18555 [Gossypium barbadense]